MCGQDYQDVQFVWGGHRTGLRPKQWKFSSDIVERMINQLKFQLILR